MEVVSEKLGAPLASMSIEDSKELDLELRLFRAVWLNARLLEVQNDADPILIIVPNQPIVGVGSICNHVGAQHLLGDFGLLHDWSDRNES